MRFLFQPSSDKSWYVVCCRYHREGRMAHLENVLREKRDVTIRHLYFALHVPKPGSEQTHGS